MKRKLLNKKSVKTLKSLHKNLQQKYDGTVKDISKKEKKLNAITDDMDRVESIIAQKECSYAPWGHK